MLHQNLSFAGVVFFRVYGLLDAIDLVSFETFVDLCLVSVANIHGEIGIMRLVPQNGFTPSDDRRHRFCAHDRLDIDHDGLASDGSARVIVTIHQFLIMLRDGRAELEVMRVGN